MMARRLRANRPAAGGGDLLPLPPVFDGLVGWWPCNDGSGTIVRDHSGNGNDAVLFGDPLPTWATEDGEECLYSVEGAGATIPFDAATISNLPNLTMTGGLNTAVIEGTILCEDYNDGLTATRGRIGLRNYDGMLARGANNILNTGIIVSNGAWHIVAGHLRMDTYPFQGALSVDGAYSTGPTYGSEDPPTDYGWTIGDTTAITTACGSCAKPFIGFVKDLRIYNRLLTDRELQDITNGIG